MGREDFTRKKIMVPVRPKKKKCLENPRTCDQCDARDKHLGRDSQEMRLRKPSVPCRA